MTQTQAQTGSTAPGSTATEGKPALSVTDLWKIFGDKSDKVIGTSDADLSRQELQAKTGCVAAVKDVSFEVRPGFGHRRATADVNGVLQMPKWARSEMVLLHEVAHCVTPWTFASHGPEYAGVLLSIVRRGMGPAAAQALEDAFDRHRVRSNSAALPVAAASAGLSAGWRRVANTRHDAACASTPGASVGEGPTDSVSAAHQREAADMVAQRDS